MSSKPFRITYEDEELTFARTPLGLEAYIPTGRPPRPKATVLVNGRYSANVDLTVGVTAIPRSVFRDEKGTLLPDSEKVMSVGVSFQDDEHHAMAFSWSK